MLTVIADSDKFRVLPAARVVVRYVCAWGGWVDKTYAREMAKTVRDKGGSRPSHAGERADGNRSRRLIDVGLLDSFAIAVDREIVQLPPSAQHLVACLAVAGRSVTRRTLASRLWMDSEESRGLARLRNSIWKVGGILPDLIVSGEQEVRLHPLVRVDLDEARATATRLLATGGSQPTTVHQESLAHDLLPDWDVEWLTVERPAFRVLRLRALEVVARRRLQDSLLYEAEQACRAVITAEPYRESARLLLAETCIAQGNVGLALKELHSFADVLTSDLGIAPNDDIQELIARIQGSGRDPQPTGRIGTDTT